MAEIKRSWFSRGGVVLAVVGLAGIVTGAFVGIDTYGVWLMAGGLFLVLIGMLIDEKFAKLQKSKEAGVRGEPRRDIEQRKWAYTVLLMPIVSFGMCIFSSDELLEMVRGLQPEITSRMLLGPLMVVFGFVFLARGLSHKDAQKWLNDELMRTYHANAMAWGFVAAFVGLLVAFGLMLWRMPAALVATPFLMWSALLVASLRLWWQVRRADG